MDYYDLLYATLHDTHSFFLRCIAARLETEIKLHIISVRMRHRKLIFNHLGQLRRIYNKQKRT